MLPVVERIFFKYKYAEDQQTQDQGQQQQQPSEQQQNDTQMNNQPTQNPGFQAQPQQAAMSPMEAGKQVFSNLLQAVNMTLQWFGQVFPEPQQGAVPMQQGQPQVAPAMPMQPGVQQMSVGPQAVPMAGQPQMAPQQQQAIPIQGGGGGY
jgi:soluble lytic murein transglycosylase-like protein